MTKKKAIILAIIALLLIVAIVTGINAYFTSIKTATNVFTIGNIQINLTEGDTWDAAVASGEAPSNAQNIVPNQHIAKAPNVENIGANPAYVYLKVYVPVTGDDDLFTYTINPTDGQTGGWTKRANEEFHTTIDGQVYNIYTYDYDEVLEPGTTTEQALFDEVVFAEGMNFTPEQVEALGNVKNIIIKAYAIQTGDGITQATNEVTALMTGDANEESGLAEDTITTTGNITTASLGQYVNLGGTSLLGKDNTTEADWRVFLKDENGAWLILADYLPVGEGTTGASVVSSVGLTTFGTYGVRSTVRRDDLITKLNGDWSSLIAGSDVAGETGVLVKGTVDLPTWVASWNANDVDTTLYTKYENPVSGKTFDGWYIGNVPEPTTKDIDLSGDKGYNNTLYFPHQSNYILDHYWAGYLLASPSAKKDVYVMYVGPDGYVYYDAYYLNHFGVRPVVYLPSSISLNTTRTVWSVMP